MMMMMMMMMMMKDEDGLMMKMKRTVCVSNLKSCVREEILYELFLQAGPVQKVDLPRDQDGNPKSYAFVQYKHAEAAPYAVALLDGIRLYGRPIALHYGNAHTPEGAPPAPVHLQNGLMDYRFSAQDDRRWSPGFTLDPFSPLLHPNQGPYVPLVPPWMWSQPGLVPWTSCSDGLTPTLDCTNSRKRGAEQSAEKTHGRKKKIGKKLKDKPVHDY